MSGRRTWMPDEQTTANKEHVQENPAPDGPPRADRATGPQPEAGENAQTTQPGSEDKEASERSHDRGEPPEARETRRADSSGAAETAHSSREWVPGGTDKKSAGTPENAQAAAYARSNADAQGADASVMDAPVISTAASMRDAGGTAPKTAPDHKNPAADADTNDIPIASRDRVADEGKGEEPATAPDGSTGRAGVWSSVRDRISGKGPLSPEREQQSEHKRQEKPEKQEQAEQAIEPGGSMDPNERMKRLSSSIQSGDHEPATAVQEDEDEREGLTGSGPLLWFIDHWIPITVPLLLVCVGIFIFATVFTGGGPGGEVASSKGGSGGGKGEPSEKAGGDANQVPLYESGLSFDYTQKDGEAELTTGDLTWEGEVTEGGDDSPKETVTLAGPTAAKINRGYEMDGESDDPGKVETMTYAVEAEGAPDIHATYQRFSGHTSNDPVDAPNGSYSVTADSGDLIAEGNYSDRRTVEGDEGNEVIRTYTETVPGEGEPQQFRVRYEAPEGTPIPALVGWQAPDVRNGGDKGSS